MYIVSNTVYNTSSDFQSVLQNLFLTLPNRIDNGSSSQQLQSYRYSKFSSINVQNCHQHIQWTHSTTEYVTLCSASGLFMHPAPSKNEAVPLFAFIFHIFHICSQFSAVSSSECGDQSCIPPLPIQWSGANLPVQEPTRTLQLSITFNYFDMTYLNYVCQNTMNIKYPWLHNHWEMEPCSWHFWLQGDSAVLRHSHWKPVRNGTMFMTFWLKVASEMRFCSIDTQSLEACMCLHSLLHYT